MIKYIRPTKYRYNPVVIDKLHPCTELKTGEIVQVCALNGCPKPGTMGHYHIAKEGKFVGMVHQNSLERIW